jgi:TatD DNase family protein
MIDCHAHLEQPQYDKDRDEVIERCRKELKAIITCCTHPKDFELTSQLVKKYNGFIFATAAIHPEYIKEIDESKKNEFFKNIIKSRENFVGIGETGLDFIIEEAECREKQKKLFLDFIQFAKELNLPLVIHARKAFKETIEILEDQKVKNVLIHFFTAKELLHKVIENDWYISVNTTLLFSKKIKKIVRDMPLERILTETDSPWLGLEKKRNEPTSVKYVIEKIAEIKGMKFEDVDRITTENAIKFFKLKLQ